MCRLRLRLDGEWWRRPTWAVHEQPDEGDRRKAASPRCPEAGGGEVGPRPLSLSHPGPVVRLRQAEEAVRAAARPARRSAAPFGERPETGARDASALAAPAPTKPAEEAVPAERPYDADLDAEIGSSRKWQPGWRR